MSQEDQVLSQGQVQPGQCAFYEECGRNPLIGPTLITPIVPCLSYTPARALTGEHYQKLKEVCPMLDRGENNTHACCSIKQLVSLKMSLIMSKSVLIRCPSCADNFAHLHCINTCSPNQTQTVYVTETRNITNDNVTKEFVLGYQAYLSAAFAEGSFKSCQNVRIPATGGFAIGTMCGRYGAKLCTAQRWYDFQGDSSNGLAPLDIDFKLIKPGDMAEVPKGLVPYNGQVLRCNETMPTGGEPCSCQDCKESCPVMPPPPLPAEPFRLMGTDGFLVISILLLCLLLVSFLLYLVVSCWVQAKERKDEESVKGKTRAKEQKAVTQRLIDPSEVTCTDKNSLAAQEFLGSLFQSWGTFMASHPLKVLLVATIFVAVFATGLMYIELTTDPIQLWSSPNSRARREKDFHDKTFDPFFRTNQLILTAPGRDGHIYDSLFFGKNNFSGILDKDLLTQLLELQTKIQNIKFWSEDLNQIASLKDVCYAPLNPSNASLTDCAVNSLLQYFQNNQSNLNAKVNMTELGVKKEVDWRDHFIYCVNSPLSFKDITGLEMSCMSDYGGPVFPFLAVGGYENEDFTNAEALIMTFSLNNYARDHPKFNVALQWEQMFLDIVQDYQRDPSNNFTFAYMAERSLEDEINRTTAEDIPIFMISYLVIFIYIAVALGEYSSCKRILVDSKFLVGLGGILVVGCSVLASMGFYAGSVSLVPFLVLAVGADNIFIFVLEYQRDMRRPGESREGHIGRVLGNVAPSMLLCSLSESICFFLGALSTMPAVKTFALYAALAVLLDFILQMTAFVAVLSLDARRQDGDRCELACCVTVGTRHPTTPNEGLLLPLMRKYYAPVLLKPVTRIVVMVVFIIMFCGSIFLMFNVKVGLDQELAMPQDSYMLEYFKYLYKYFEVGIPTYFVTTKGFNFTTPAGMDAVCSSVGCDQFSLTQKIRYATEYPELSYLAIPANSWVDDFIDWLNPVSNCCRLYTSGTNIGDFCPATTRFMAYHTALTNSQEFTAALEKARELALNITLSMRAINGTSPDFEVFPYTMTYAFYEQYLTIVPEGLLNISLCLLPTFAVCCLLLGMDLRSGLLNLLTIVMITVDTAVGISVEFVSHLTRSFALSTKLTHVLAGVAMTNLPGIIVLAFAKAQLIQIFFFRLNLVITLLGMAHGLVFLPEQARQETEMSDNQHHHARGNGYCNAGYEHGEKSGPSSATQHSTDSAGASDITATETIGVEEIAKF
ncbi:hypothetical protein CRUP_010928 [Coryphaenoides rupestris]|nr:hypothetical protein CRUP_010928 [Coryphaenoides rupestris]